jgi:hypothetical protein
MQIQNDLSKFEPLFWMKDEAGHLDLNKWTTSIYAIICTIKIRSYCLQFLDLKVYS